MQPPKLMSDPRGENRVREPSLAAPASGEPKPPPNQSATDDSSLESRRAGAELPAGIYRTVAVAYAWMLLVAWLDFSGTVEASWLASVAIIIGIVLLGIPFLLRRTNRAVTRESQPDLDEFLHSDLETATGRVPGWEAYLQIIMIPLCLALAATAIGAIWVWES
jgi:hypothetical protein